MNTTRIAAPPGLVSGLLALALAILPLSPLAFADTNTADTSSASATAASSTTQSASDTASTTGTALTSSTSTLAATTTDDLTLHLSASSTPGLFSASTTPDASSTVIGTSTPDGFVVASSTSNTTVLLSDASSSASAASTTPAAKSGTEIVTGTSTAFANILNLLNTSFLNSSGSILFANFTDPAGTIDLRAPGLLFAACVSGACSDLSGVQLNQLQDAHIDNEIVVSANSGANAIANASSSAAIETGDALAGLNLINIANVTFANAHYMLIALNAFRGVNGDIVFPSLAQFLTAATGAVGNVDLVNSAAVDNNVRANAGTGDNTASAIGASAIMTGSSTAQTNMYNALNSLFGGGGLSILIRVGNDWAGQIFGLPSSVQSFQTPGAIYITSSAGGTPTSITQLSALGTSSAAIANNAQVDALTGGNSIDASSTALISTGNAFAGANIINLANQTIIGKNWLLAILNIFGDFKGNIAFGRPDLWVGAQESGSPTDGADVTYTFTVKNHGDSDASNVSLTTELDAAHLSAGSSSVPLTTDASGHLVFSLGTLAPGESAAVIVHATVHGTPGTTITTTGSATAHEPDSNIADNTDSVTITIPSVGGGGSGFSNLFTALLGSGALSGGAPAASESASVTATRLVPHASASTLAPAVAESIELTSGDTPARGVVFDDQLIDPSGTVVHEEQWTIGDLAAHDDILVQYNFTFGPAAPLGTYRLRTTIWGDNVATTTVENGSIEYTLAIQPTVVIPGFQVAASTNMIGISRVPQLPRHARHLSAPKRLSVKPRIPNAGAGVRAAQTSAAAAAAIGWDQLTVASRASSSAFLRPLMHGVRGILSALQMHL